MLIPPKYSLTPKISKLLSEIEASREVINSIQIPPEIEANIRRQSTLKSSLFSARVEGNNLNLEDLPKRPSTDQKRREVYNILKALNWIQKRAFRDINQKDLLELHKVVLLGLAGEDGDFRKEVSAIFNKAGIAVYMPPRPQLLPSLINRFIKFTNSAREPFVPIKASLAHYTFEKIHPFLDGNGRVGRLIFQLVLKKGGYDMKGLVAVEEYLDLHRAEYYHFLESPERDVTDYVEFMLEALAESAQVAKRLVVEKQKAEVEDLLLPRRGEILRLVKEQKLINFESIHRRFSNINKRTLRYDLKRLVDSGLVKKLGTTRGVYYQPNSQS